MSDKRTYTIKRNDRLWLDDDQEPVPLEVDTVTVELRPVISDMVEAVDAFYRDYYHRPKWLLLGWQTYLRFEHEVRGSRSMSMQYAWVKQWWDADDYGAFMGHPLLVDDTVADLIRPLPGAKAFRPGGRR